MNNLSLSSLAHIYAIIPFILYGGIYDPLYSLYCAVIMVASLTYASLHEWKGSPVFSAGVIMIADYIATMVWFTMDVYISNWRCDEKTATNIMQMDNAILIMYIVAFQSKIGEPDLILFTLNSLSAAKSVYVSYLIVKCSPA